MLKQIDPTTEKHEKQRLHLLFPFHVYPGDQPQASYGKPISYPTLVSNSEHAFCAKTQFYLSLKTVAVESFNYLLCH